MFKLVQLKPEGSDCTAPYEVQLNGEYTVEQFINDVILDKREWGRIGIDDGKSIFGDPVCEYKWGQIVSTMEEKFLKMRIVSAKASGGWSNMDYLLTVEPVNGEFVEITTHYGIRPEDVFGHTAFVVYRIGDEKNPENHIAGFRNKNAAINECKYLERLNAPKWSKEQ